MSNVISLCDYRPDIYRDVPQFVHRSEIESDEYDGFPAIEPQYNYEYPECMFKDPFTGAIFDVICIRTLKSLY